MEISLIITTLISLVLGGAVVALLLRKAIEKRGARLIEEAGAKADLVGKEKILHAKEKFMQLKSEHEKVITERNRNTEEGEKKLATEKATFSTKVSEFQTKEDEIASLKDTLSTQQKIVNKKQEDLDKYQKRSIEQLEVISSLSVESAKSELIEALKDEAKTEAMALVQEIIEEAKLSADQEAKKIVIQTIQRVGTEHAVDNSITVFNIKSDELKGKIIGKEGRNIRALEAATGVEIIVDDTPEAVILSCYDPVRRECCKIALNILVEDGRIHPARIEEVVAKTKKKIEQDIIETGKKTAVDLEIHGLHPDLIRMVGRMKYRSSYGQNLLQHSRETANLCAIMAAELGLDVKMAKRAGLLHDIGKVPEDQPELPHAILGMKIAEKCKEKEEVCNAIGAHHDEIDMTGLLSPIVQVCDGISGARPGARREASDQYIKRLKDLEEIALDNKGVVSAYAIQAGRELRVIVESATVTDKESSEMAFGISQKIQSDLTYPGQVTVTVIRETRSVSIAK